MMMMMVIQLSVSRLAGVTICISRGHVQPPFASPDGMRKSLYCCRAAGVIIKRFEAGTPQKLIFSSFYQRSHGVNITTDTVTKGLVLCSMEVSNLVTLTQTIFHFLTHIWL